MDKDKWPDKESAKTLAQISSVIFQSTVYSSSADVPRIWNFSALNKFSANFACLSVGQHVVHGQILHPFLLYLHHLAAWRSLNIDD